jgi:pantoate--beta-alanine ligase
MILFKRPDDLIDFIQKKRKSIIKIGFIPTMGALHHGHISLIEKSKSENDITICSIFINPTQFNNPNDFKKYPVTIESDIEQLELNGCDILFMPSVDDIYPENFQKSNFELGYLDNILEGKHRAGHFQGVCMVVKRLLEIVKCDILYLGQKDYQQCMVIKKMATDLNIPVEIKISPTIREENGLAMSSRNKRLNEAEKEAALVIIEVLCFLKDNIFELSIPALLQTGGNKLTSKGFKVDYIEITDEILNPIKNAEKNQTIVALIAATIGDVRLIDNMILNNANNAE